MRASFVVAEVGIGLRRNLTLTVAAIVTVAVSLGLLGAGLLVRQQVQTINRFYYGKLQVAVFLTKDISDDQRMALQSKIENDPLVKAFTYESKAEAYEKFKEENKDSPDLIAVTPADALPESFRIQLKDPKQYDIAKSDYEQEAGVDTVYNYKALLDPFFKLFAGLEQTAFVIALIQVLASTLLIYNTVRVSAFGRRRETGIMRLVGASSFSIQLPFLVEGAVAGLFGGALACGALALSKVFVIDNLLYKAIPNALLPRLGWSDVLGTMPPLLLVGVALSSIASFVTLRRFVRV